MKNHSDFERAQVKALSILQLILAEGDCLCNGVWVWIYLQLLLLRLWAGVSPVAAKNRTFQKGGMRNEPDVCAKIKLGSLTWMNALRWTTAYTRNAELQGTGEHGKKAGKVRE